MDCRDVTALAIDRLAGEADEESRRELSAHLSSCDACRSEMARLEGVWTTLGADPDAVVSAGFRDRTLALLEEETLRRRVRSFRPRSGARFPKSALQAAALAAAVVLGYAVARRVPPGAPAPATGTAAHAAVPTPIGGPGSDLPDLGMSPRFSNVTYAPGADGQVNIAFDVTTRREVAGRPEDPEVARLLAYMVSRNAETAGEKSRAIELVSSHFGGQGAPASAEIVTALSNTLRRDANPGVRKKAADALASFAMTPEIRTVLLESLRSDRNPAVRLVAVEALAASAKLSPDARTIASLREKAVDPQENGFVRARAASALKAISF